MEQITLTLICNDGLHPIPKDQLPGRVFCKQAWDAGIAFVAIAYCKKYHHDKVCLYG